jgi:Asp-tRNA(Asn)/Glu-tRNA(Gln) amidotransferase C subunit
MIKHTATLAQLSFDDAEVAALVPRFQAFLGFVDRMRAVPDDGASLGACVCLCVLRLWVSMLVTCVIIVVVVVVVVVVPSCRRSPLDPLLWEPPPPPLTISPTHNTPTNQPTNHAAPGMAPGSLPPVEAVLRADTPAVFGNQDGIFANMAAQEDAYLVVPKVGEEDV